MDYHTPATIVRQENGSNALMLKYKNYKIEDGKPKLEGLPAAYVENEKEAQTLTITLEDELTGPSMICFTLFIVTFPSSPVPLR